MKMVDQNEDRQFQSAEAKQRRLFKSNPAGLFWDKAVHVRLNRSKS